MNLLVLPAVLLLATSAAPNRIEGSVGAGAGYDSNLDLAASGTGVGSFGTTTVSIWADLGWAVEPTYETRFYVGPRYDGVFCLDAPDLTRHVPGLDLSFTYEPLDWLALTVTPGVGYAFYGNTDRDAVRVGARAIVRVRPWRWLALRVGYARAQSWASDDVYSLGTDRLLTNVEARLARRTYLAAGYALSSGDQVFYRVVTAAGGGTGVDMGRGRGVGAHGGTGMFSTLEPYKASATEHTLSARWEQGLWSELYYTVSYEFTRGHGAEGDYDVHSVFGGMGYRF